MKLQNLGGACMAAAMLAACTGSMAQAQQMYYTPDGWVYTDQFGNVESMTWDRAFNPAANMKMPGTEQPILDPYGNIIGSTWIGFDGQEHRDVQVQDPFSGQTAIQRRMSIASDPFSSSQVNPQSKGKGVPGIRPGMNPPRAAPPQGAQGMTFRTNPRQFRGMPAGPGQGPPAGMNRRRPDGPVGRPGMNQPGFVVRPGPRKPTLGPDVPGLGLQQGRAGMHPGANRHRTARPSQPHSMQPMRSHGSSGMRPQRPGGVAYGPR